jgi:solute carrier family 25 (peroxisomal adenine nucleotide transporter), member 17
MWGARRVNVWTNAGVSGVLKMKGIAEAKNSSLTQRQSDLSMQAQRQEALVDALAGALANVVTVWAFYPLDLYKTRIQTSRRSSCTSGISTGQHCRHTHTVSTTELTSNCILIIRRYYDGIGMKTIHAAVSSFSYFYLYSWIASTYTSTISRHAGRRSQSSAAHCCEEESIPSPQVRLLLTALAAMGNTLLTLPLDVIATRRQTTRVGDEFVAGDNTEQLLPLTDESSADGSTKVRCPAAEFGCTVPLESSDRSSALQCALRLRHWLRHVLHFWRGLWPALLLCSNPAIHYTLYDAVKARYISRRSAGQSGDLTMYEAFVLGWIAKFISTIATYPLIAAKSKLMATSSTGVSESLIQCLRDDYRDGGVPTLYRGCTVQLYHTVLKSALMMMLKEKITAVTYKIING